MQFQLLSWEFSIQRRQPSIEQLVAAYNRLAHSWTKKLTRLGMDQAYQGLMMELSAAQVLPSLTPTSRVLDVGIGTGALTGALYHAQPVGWQVDGADVANEMLVESATHLAGLSDFGLQLRLHQRDLRRLPFAPATFDLVMSAHTLEHLPDPVAALRGLVQLLRPGAPLLVIITRKGHLGTLVDAQWGINCPTPAELVGWLAEAGLVQPQLVPLPGPTWCRWMSLAAIGRRPADGA